MGIMSTTSGMHTDRTGRLLSIRSMIINSKIGVTTSPGLITQMTSGTESKVLSLDPGRLTTLLGKLGKMILTLLTIIEFKTAPTLPINSEGNQGLISKDRLNKN